MHDDQHRQCFRKTLGAFSFTDELQLLHTHVFEPTQFNQCSAHIMRHNDEMRPVYFLAVPICQRAHWATSKQHVLSLLSHSKTPARGSMVTAQRRAQKYPAGSLRFVTGPANDLVGISPHGAPKRLLLQAISKYSGTDFGIRSNSLMSWIHHFIFFCDFVNLLHAGISNRLMLHVHDFVLRVRRLRSKLTFSMKWASLSAVTSVYFEGMSAVSAFCCCKQWGWCRCRCQLKVPRQRCWEYSGLPLWWIRR